MPFTTGFGNNPAKVFRDYLSAFALDDAQVLDFAANALQLFSEGSLRFSAVRKIVIGYSAYLLWLIENSS
jgi:hypothetical protein